MNEFYTDYSAYLHRLFPDSPKVQKISVARGARTCPNRDGTIGTGGCIYCRNESFTPAYCLEGMSVSAQIEAGRRFFGRKYPDMRFLVYFQSFTATHGDEASLLADVAEAAAAPGVVGVIIGTRPDCVPDAMLDSLEASGVRIMFELGAETCSDRTLRRINRGHTWSDVESAARRIAARGFECGLHLIAGLPGETLADALRSVEAASALPIGSIKLHQMQVIAGTRLAALHALGQSGLIPFSLDEYLDFCTRVVATVPRRIAIERFLSAAPPSMLIAPRWGLKNYEFTARLLSRLRGGK